MRISTRRSTRPPPERQRARAHAAPRTSACSVSSGSLHCSPPSPLSPASTTLTVTGTGNVAACSVRAPPRASAWSASSHPQRAAQDAAHGRTCASATMTAMSTTPIMSVRAILIVHPSPVQECLGTPRNEPPRNEPPTRGIYRRPPHTAYSATFPLQPSTTATTMLPAAAERARERGDRAGSGSSLPAAPRRSSQQPASQQPASSSSGR